MNTHARDLSRRSGNPEQTKPACAGLAVGGIASARMCALLLSWLTGQFFTVQGATVYVDGCAAAGGDGSAARPLTTLQLAHDHSASGDTISMKSGWHAFNGGPLSRPVRLVANGGIARIGGPAGGLRVNAGTNQWVRFPSTGGGALLVGQFTYLDCNPPRAATATWQHLGGPSGFRFQYGNNGLSAIAIFSQPGTNLFRLTVTDGINTARSDVTVVGERCANDDCVGPGPGGCTLTADAGTSQSGATDQPVYLTGRVTCGSKIFSASELEVEWKALPPLVGAVIFARKEDLVTSARFSAPGQYQLQLQATEIGGRRRTATDRTTITITNSPPRDPCVDLTVTAGHDFQLEMPLIGDGVCTLLNGAVAWRGGSALPADTTISWSRVAGPNAVTFANVQDIHSRACFDVAGDYVLRLTARRAGCQRFADVRVRVTKAPCPAILVNAGPDRAIYLDTNEVCLALTGSVQLGTSGLQPTYQWRSRQLGVHLANPRSLSTQVCFSQPGVYTLNLTAQVGECESSDTVVISVQYGAWHFITYRLVPVNAQLFNPIFKNTHPTASVRFRLYLGDRASGNPTELEITLRPGEEKGYFTTVGWKILSASFVGTPPAPLPSELGTLARVQLPAANQGTVANGTMDFLLQLPEGEAFRVESSHDMLNWTPLTNGMAGDQPLWIRHPEAQRHTKTFYRVVKP